jgi:hypothetical protein
MGVSTRMHDMKAGLTDIDRKCYRSAGMTGSHIRRFRIPLLFIVSEASE